MQISSNSSTMTLSALQRLLQGPSSGAASAGQEAPSARQKPPTAAMSGIGGPQFGGGAMGAMMALQIAPPSDTDVADHLIGALDSDDDGSVSLTEIQSAFSQAGVNTDINDAFSAIDGDGDGQLSSDELTSAVGAMRAHHMAEGGPPPGPPPSDQIAQSVLTAFDSDSDSNLSLSELTSALGQDSASSAVSQRFSSLDANGDGQLSASELAAAFRSQMQAAMRAYTDHQDAAATMETTV